MDNLNMNLTLEPVLANICQQLADFFGTTTDAIIDHAPEFLAKYGWYCTLKNLGPMMILFVFIGVILAGLTVLGCVAFNEEYLYDNNYKRLNPKKCAIIIFILIILFALSCELLPTVIAPEFVGLEHLLQMISGE